MKEMPNLPDVPCKCWEPQDYEDGIGCACGDSERVLRAVQRGDLRLNDEQREWCLSEIDQVEGYTREEYAMADDYSLALGVFSAWTDYARDKGLI